MTEREDYMNDYRAVSRNEKPMMIVERRKSRPAYQMIRNNAGISFAPAAYDILLADDKGVNGAALVVTRDANLYQDFLELLANRSKHTRNEWQAAIGKLLGHTPESCEWYSGSTIGKTCECQLCGGPDEQTRRINRAEHDAHVRRTMFYL